MLYKMVVGFCKRANILWPNSTNWLKVFFFAQTNWQVYWAYFSPFSIIWFEQKFNRRRQNAIIQYGSDNRVQWTLQVHEMHFKIKLKRIFFFANKIEVQTERSILIWCNHARKACVLNRCGGSFPNSNTHLNFLQFALPCDFFGNTN